MLNAPYNKARDESDVNCYLGFLKIRIYIYRKTMIFSIAVSASNTTQQQYKQNLTNLIYVYVYFQ